MARDPYSKNRPKYWKELLGADVAEQLISQAHRNATRIKGRQVMFKSKSGKPFHNPAIGRQHDRDAAAGKAPDKKREPEHDGGGPDADDGADHGAVHKAEYHHPDGAENPSPGKHHTVMSHEDGHQEHMDHDSAAEAHAHMQAASGDEEPDADDMGGPGDSDQDDYGDIGGDSGY